MKKKKGETPDCASCKPTVLDENLPIMYLIERYYATMFSDNGLSASGIAFAFDCELWVKDYEKSNYANKIIIYLNSLKSATNRNK